MINSAGVSNHERNKSVAILRDAREGALLRMR